MDGADPTEVALATVDDPDPRTDDDAETGTANGDAGATTHPWSWHFVRVSGLFLAVMLIVQFTVSFLTTDVARTTALTMTDRWHDVTWRTFEVLVLVLALAHGALALRSAVQRSALAPSRARVLGIGVYALAGGFAAATLTVAFRFR